MKANNTAAMREALDDILDRIDTWRGEGSMEHWQYSQLFDIADAALSAPPRNCDMGTAEEQAQRFAEMCGRYYHEEYPCDKRCPLSSSEFITGFPRCQAYWAQMPYEEGGAK